MSEQSSTGQETEERGFPLRQLLTVGAVLGLFAGGIALAYHLSSEPFLKGGFALSTTLNKNGARNGTKNSTPSKPLFYMEPLIMNATDVGASSFVRVTLTLELERPEVSDMVRARLAAIENAVVVTAASRTTTMLRSAEGKARLRDELTNKINALLPDGGVRAVYFADFLVR